MVIIGYYAKRNYAKHHVPVGEHVRREACARGRNMNIILAINQELGVVHHQLGNNSQ